MVMYQFVLKRLATIVPIVFGITFFSYFLLSLLPGDAALAQGLQSPAALARVRAALGLDHPLWDRYRHWLWEAVHGNLGLSLNTSQPIRHIIWQRTPTTIELVVFALIISIALSIPLAALAAQHAGGVTDKVLSVVAMLGVCCPGFVWGLILMYIFAVHLQLLPATGFSPIGDGLVANVKSLLLPAVTLAFSHFATYTRILRNDIAEQLASEDYVITARAKGMSSTVVLVRHVLRNALMSFVTVVGINLGTLIGGSVIVESLFSIPGTGQLLVSAINDRDVTVVQGLVVVVAIAVVLANLGADILSTAIDPRVRFGRRDA